MCNFQNICYLTTTTTLMGRGSRYFKQGDRAEFNYLSSQNWYEGLMRLEYIESFILCLYSWRRISHHPTGTGCWFIPIVILLDRQTIKWTTTYHSLTDRLRKHLLFRGWSGVQCVDLHRSSRIVTVLHPDNSGSLESLYIFLSYMQSNRCFYLAKNTLIYYILQSII